MSSFKKINKNQQRQQHNRRFPLHSHQQQSNRISDTRYGQKNTPQHHGGNSPRQLWLKQQRYNNCNHNLNNKLNFDDEFEGEDEDDIAMLTQQQQQQQETHKGNKHNEHLCNQHHVPAHATFSLSSISSLVQYATPGSVIIFDIDDTLIKRKHSNISLLTPTGTSMFHAYLQSQACSTMSYEKKQALVNQLGSALKSFVLAEDDTAAVVQSLQKRGCYVFALTARSSTMSTTTNQCLSSLGINFRSSAPPTMPLQTIEPQTGAAVIDGIIYCNDQPKGVVFQKLFAQQWITFPVLHNCEQQQHATCSLHNTIVTSTGSQPSHEKKHACPERTVWFIDDSLPMLSSMLTSWQQYAHNRVEFFSSLQPHLQSKIQCQGKLALVCCHYAHPTNYTLNPTANPCTIPDDQLEPVIALQIHTFIKKQQLLSDADALHCIQQSNADVLHYMQQSDANCTTNTTSVGHNTNGNAITTTV